MREAWTRITLLRSDPAALGRSIIDRINRRMNPPNTEAPGTQAVDSRTVAPAAAPAPASEADGEASSGEPSAACKRQQVAACEHALTVAASNRSRTLPTYVVV